MKKILTFLAMTASILMVSTAVSCNKNDDDDDDGGEDSEYVAPIKIEAVIARKVRIFFMI